jgi:hypothetical protein
MYVRGKGMFGLNAKRLRMDKDGDEEMGSGERERVLSGDRVSLAFCLMACGVDVCLDTSEGPDGGCPYRGDVWVDGDEDG